MTTDFTLWHDGAKWRYEVSFPDTVKRGWRPTRQWAKRAARRLIHRARP